MIELRLVYNALMPSFKFLIFIAAMLAAACRQPVKNQEPALLSFFQSAPASDTLRFEITGDGADAPVYGDTIPNALFFTALPAGWLGEIDYVADSTQALVLGRQRFPLDDSTDAWHVDIRQFWFQHQSLLLYNKNRQAFTTRITVAEWYGGDGGQDLTGSWLTDYDGDGDKDLIRRLIRHSSRPEGDTVREDFYESAELFLWGNGQFSPENIRDTSAIIRRFPLRWPW